MSKRDLVNKPFRGLVGFQRGKDLEERVLMLKIGRSQNL